MQRNVNLVCSYLKVNQCRKDLKTRWFGMSLPLTFKIVVHHLERERKLLVQQCHPEDKTTSYIMTGKVTHVRISTWRLIWHAKVVIFSDKDLFWRRLAINQWKWKTWELLKTILGWKVHPLSNWLKKSQPFQLLTSAVHKIWFVFCRLLWEFLFSM